MFYIKDPDGKLTIMIESTEYNIVPGQHQYDEVLWAIENERSEIIPDLLAASEVQEEYRPSDNIWTRKQAIKALADLVMDGPNETLEEKALKIAELVGLTNKELADQLDLAGFYDEELPIVNDSPDDDEYAGEAGLQKIFGKDFKLPTKEDDKDTE
jgi:hypothetical protein